MALSSSEQQTIVNTILSSLRTNSRTIEQLSLLTSLADNDSLEVTGGRRITYGNLKTILTAIFQGLLADLWTALNKEINNRQTADQELGGRISQEASERKAEDTALGQRITKEIGDRQSADTALGQRIDNEANARQSADTALGQRIDGVNQRIEPMIYCAGFLNYGQNPTSNGTYLQRDNDGDLVQIVTRAGSSITRAVPEEGILYTCGGKSYHYNGIMLVPSGHTYFIFDGGKADTQDYCYGESIGGGSAATDMTIAKRINCGGARFV